MKAHVTEKACINNINASMSLKLLLMSAKRRLQELKHLDRSLIKYSCI